MTCLLHISDPHFGTVQDPVASALMHLAEQQRPDHVLLSGDITQRARRKQFAAARAFTERLPAPVLAVPGNHDIPLFNLFARLVHPYRNYSREFGSDLEPVLETEQLLVVSVNSTKPARHKNGEVTPAQIARVAARLKQARPGQLRIVMQHHPVRAIEESDQSNLLIGRAEAIPEWVDAGLDLLLAGHIHLPYIRPLSGRHSPRQGWTAQAGTALSARVRGNIPNSVNLIRHQCRDGLHECSVERWDYNATEHVFELFSETDLALHRSD
ncbi:MAG: metallophosphoesterase [Halopseudomonas sp.]|uniref:metallophosphoesterase family protein n=1 Tax=Halopseudomonas sp. TaxID=2901191 RepID=UPI00300210D4